MEEGWVHRGRVDAFGYLFLAIVYSAIAEGVLALAVWRVGSKVAVPWASPWRMRLPKLLIIGGPALFILALVVVLTGIQVGVAVAFFISALVAPLAGVVLITVEWLRRRAEDRATGIARPERPWI